MRVRTLVRSFTYTFGLAAFLSVLAALAGARPACAQLGFDRPGGDYASAPVPSGDPAVCAARCEHDKSCRSWSFSYPSASGEQAMCWLKREVVPRAKASCCVSGVRGAGVIEPRARRGRIFDRPRRRRLPVVRYSGRPARQGLRGRVQSRQPLPRLDVSAAGLRHRCRAVLSEGHDQAAAPQSVLRLRRRAMRRGRETRKISAHSRESGNPAWVPACAGSERRCLRSLRLQARPLTAPS